MSHRVDYPGDIGSATRMLPIRMGGEIPDLPAALRELSEPWPSGDRIKAAIDRAARRAGLSYWRAFDIWYGKARRVEDGERKRIAEALTKRREEAARHELHELKLRIARLEALLARASQDGAR